MMVYMYVCKLCKAGLFWQCFELWGDTKGWIDYVYIADLLTFNLLFHWLNPQRGRKINLVVRIIPPME